MIKQTTNSARPRVKSRSMKLSPNSRNSERANGKRKIRYAVVGLGWISQAAALPAFQNATKNSELVALVSDDPEKLKKLGKQYKTPHLYSYDDYETLLNSGEVDAVYIGLPNHMHAEYTIRAAQCGVHVLCEKPMAVTAQECEDMIRACNDNNVKLMIAYRLHFEPANLNTIELIENGKIGEPRFFVSTHTMNVEDPDNIRLDSVAQGGGPVYDIGIYSINAARYVFQAEPDEVIASSATGKGARFRESGEIVSAILRFPQERLASFTCALSTEKESVYSVVGTNGMVVLNDAFSYNSDIKQQVTINGKKREKVFKTGDQFGPEFLYFSNCILNDEDPEPSGEEGLNDVRIIRAIHESAARNAPVRLDEMTQKELPNAEQVIKAPKSKEPKELINAKTPSGTSSSKNQ